MKFHLAILLLPISIVLGGKGKGGKKGKKGQDTCRLPKSPLEDEDIASCFEDADTVSELNTIIMALAEAQDDYYETEGNDPLLFVAENIVEKTQDPAAFEIAADGSYANYTYPQRVSSSDLFVLAQTETQVQAAVLYAQACDKAVTARSGGHSYLALSTSCANAAIENDMRGCMVIDVGALNQKSYNSEDEAIILGPGNDLEEVAEFMNSQEENIMLPAGVCVGVGIGGHTQTGGYGIWARALGTLASRVLGFRIVLSNGVVQEVVKPDEYSTALNDDLYYAVLGGASGSWGVITEITFRPAVGLASFFVQAFIFWDVEGISKMMRKLAESTIAFADDTRWGIQTTAYGLEPVGQPNQFQIDFTWVSPEEEKGDYDPSFIQDILDACEGCNIYFYRASEERPSDSYKNIYLLPQVDDYEFPDPLRYYARSLQHTNTYPTPDMLETVVRMLDTIMPSANDPYTFISQPSFALLGDNKDISLPWPEAKFAVTLDAFVPASVLLPFITDISLRFAAFLRDLFGEDNRMYWGAYEEDGPINIKEDAGLYFESAAKYERLQEIKTCVDEGNLFKNSMSIPPAIK